MEPDAIQLVESKEGVHAVIGLVALSPHVEVKTRSYNGRSKVKGAPILPSFAALQKEIDNMRASFDKGDDWFDSALVELKKIDGHGWGQTDALLTWGDRKTVLVATENCPVCNGTAQRPCPDCRGLGSGVCPHCEGRGQEFCPHCDGRGVTPSDPSKPCPECHGARFIVCRFCHQTGKLPCPTCQGRGMTPCDQCRGTGFITREAHIQSGARLSFSLVNSATRLPSGLLRAISRIGEENLPKGHADVALQEEEDAAKESKEGKKRPTTVRLEARLPYADIKIRFGAKTSVIACAGKKGRLFGVPAFLDDSLTSARRDLMRAAQGAVPLAHALSARAFRDALVLILSGKTHPNALRRLYPVGLSGEVAQQIMRSIASALRAETRKLRAIVAAGCFGLSGGIFSLFLFTPIAAALTPLYGLLLKGALPVLVLGLDWVLLSQASRSILKRKFPAAGAARLQPIGRTGYAMRAGVALLDAALLAFSAWA